MTITPITARILIYTAFPPLCRGQKQLSFHFLFTSKDYHSISPIKRTPCGAKPIFQLKTAKKKAFTPPSVTCLYKKHHLPPNNP